MAAREIARKNIPENKRNVFFTGYFDILSEIIFMFFAPLAAEAGLYLLISMINNITYCQYVFYDGFSKAFSETNLSFGKGSDIQKKYKKIQSYT